MFLRDGKNMAKIFNQARKWSTGKKVALIRGLLHILLPLLILVLLGPLVANGEEFCSTQYRFCFQNRLALSELADKNPSLWGLLQEAKTSITKEKLGTKQAQNAVVVLETVREEIKKILPNVPKPDLINSLLVELESTIQWFREAGFDRMPPDMAPVDLEKWKLEPDSSGPGGTAIQLLKSKGCWDGPIKTLPPECSAYYKTAIALAEQIVVIREVIDFYNSAERSRVYELFEMRVAQWNAYFYATQFQYVWELVINRWIDDNLREIPRDQFGNELGLRDAPKEKGIFFHPDVGLQYLTEQPSGDRVVPAIIFQWVGYQWWKGYKGDQVEGLKGISVVSTIADHREGASTVDVGVMFHWENYSLAFTSNRYALAVTFNLKIGDRLSRVNEKWENEIKKANSEKEIKN